MERQNMAHINNAPGEAVWPSGSSTEDHHIRRGNIHPSVTANDNKKMNLYTGYM